MILQKRRITDRISDRWFQFVHGNNLIYNTCWEDPRLDRQALQLSSDDSVLVITSAGCNSLDYALDSPKNIFAVDVNARQNALLELKIAGIRRLDFETFFSLFGYGRLQDFKQVYRSSLREGLSESSQRYWDRHGKYFTGRGWRDSLYFRGASGAFARLINFYIDRVAKVRGQINEILAAPTIQAQREIYHGTLKKAFWSRFIKWAIKRDGTLALLGVPRAQRQQIDRTYPGGVVQFVEDSLDAVFADLPLKDNYFWRVYLTGSYTPQCCPGYLKKQNFERLKGGLVERITVFNGTILQFLLEHDHRITRFVLLDHMDWLSVHRRHDLKREWQAMVDRAAPGARFLWRSGGLHTDFIDPIEVTQDGRQQRLGELLDYDDELSGRLHAADRVHTYGSFYIADLRSENASEGMLPSGRPPVKSGRADRP